MMELSVVRDQITMPQEANKNGSQYLQGEGGKNRQPLQSSQSTSMRYQSQTPTKKRGTFVKERK